LVSEWRVLKTPSFSDHRYIQFRYVYKRTPKVTVYRNPRNTGWEKWRSKIRERHKKMLRDPVQGITECVSHIMPDMKNLEEDLGGIRHHHSKEITSKNTSKSPKRQTMSCFRSNLPYRVS